MSGVIVVKLLQWFRDMHQQGCHLQDLERASFLIQTAPDQTLESDTWVSTVWKSLPWVPGTYCVPGTFFFIVMQSLFLIQSLHFSYRHMDAVQACTHKSMHDINVIMLFIQSFNALWHTYGATVSTPTWWTNTCFRFNTLFGTWAVFTICWTCEYIKITSYSYFWEDLVKYLFTIIKLWVC